MPSALIDQSPMFVRDPALNCGSGWVEELVVRCDSQPDSLREVIEAGRLAGRKVRLIPAAPVSKPPLARNRERWSSETRDGDQTLGTSAASACGALGPCSEETSST